MMPRHCGSGKSRQFYDHEFPPFEQRKEKHDPHPKGTAMRSAIARGNYVDNTITSLTGSSQQALADNPHRNSLFIQNTGNANVGVNLAGGTASIGGTGTITLAAGASIGPFFTWVPINQINVIGTSGQPLLVLEG